MPCRGTYTVDPDVRTFPNGDPGYPPSSFVDWTVICKCDYWNSSDIYPLSETYQQMEDRLIAVFEKAQDDFWAEQERLHPHEYEPTLPDSAPHFTPDE